MSTEGELHLEWNHYKVRFCGSSGCDRGVGWELGEVGWGWGAVGGGGGGADLSLNLD